MKKFKYILKKCNNIKLFSKNEKILDVLEKVVNKSYIVLKEYKNDKRTYVAKIEIEGKKYILKKPYQTTLLKKIIGIFKKCESLVVFENINKLKIDNVNELVGILGGGVKKEKLVVKEEFYIMEYAEGNIYLEDEKYLKIMEIVEKIHVRNRYHGDCNPYNFLFNKDEIYILDTKVKKMYFGNYRAHYDILTLMKYFSKKVEYPYKKNIFYYIALFLRKKRN